MILCLRQASRPHYNEPKLLDSNLSRARLEPTSRPDRLLYFGCRSRLEELKFKVFACIIDIDGIPETIYQAQQSQFLKEKN